MNLGKPNPGNGHQWIVLTLHNLPNLNQLIQESENSHWLTKRHPAFIRKGCMTRESAIDTGIPSFRKERMYDKRQSAIMTGSEVLLPYLAGKGKRPSGFY